MARLSNALKPRARDAKQIELIFDPFTGVIPALFVDPVMIESALTNLIENACKYGHRKSIVIITPKVIETGFAIEVINDGIPILPEELDLLLYEGYRSPLARSVASGQGFGLNIVSEIMQLHGGTVRVSHAEGKTTVRLSFPREIQFKEFQKKQEQT